MPAQHIDRLEFLQQLLDRLQRSNGYTAQELAHHFGKSLRKVQRDLKALVENGQVVVEDETAHTYRYRAAPDSDGVDPVFWGYVMQTMEQHVASVVPAKRLDAALKKLREHDGGARLGEDLFQVAPDTLPLLPAQFNPVVLSTILLALTTGKALQVKYRYRDNTLGDLCSIRRERYSPARVSSCMCWSGMRRTLCSLTPCTALFRHKFWVNLHAKHLVLTCPRLSMRVIRTRTGHSKSASSC